MADRAFHSHLFVMGEGRQPVCCICGHSQVYASAFGARCKGVASAEEAFGHLHRYITRLGGAVLVSKVGAR